MLAVVVGGGIAGPATAMALQAVGVDAVILEARAAGRRGGSWFTISPNGLAALAAIDALDVVRGLGVPTRTNVMMGATGRELGVLPLGAPLDDGTPALSFRRPDLAAALLDEARRRGIEVHDAARAESATTTPDGATVAVADGRRFEADLVIGADGIHSVVRAAIDPDAPAGRYVGLTNFGGITRDTPIASTLPPDSWYFVFGRRAFFGALPTPAGDVVWFANVPREPISPAERAATPVDRWQEILTDLATGDHGPFAELIGGGELELVADNTYDMPSVPVWHRGRLGLVGDAIHAPAPSSGQGASMALEDAVEMASSIAAADSVTGGFAAFEATRRARVEKVVAVGARASSTKTPGGLRRVVNDAVMRLVFRYAVTERSQAWMFDHRVRLDPVGGAGT
ncbi:FAD-dependent monooxygenase [Gordonia insulae]|uniref:FAD-dependent urate hydroxylase n=1 Tax=Gordonia insulae TaxID=2420509 RepID=A0A3G8JU63_9ACTN|nr:NAD(P)/FAD-dependent oxidoreductase [Gordonia insulae]AZG48416.1 FAD-dependent urate hydroxylase [Gordonia insulae]